jgi:branched-subunit amino acid aminotransferase/4-amino-4-deoxychorismate lyase
MDTKSYAILWTPEGQAAQPIDPWGHDGAYTTILIDGKPPQPIFLQRHLDRLENSLSLLKVPQVFPKEFVEEKILEAASMLDAGTMLRVAIIQEGLSLISYPQQGKNADMEGIPETVQRHLPEAKSLLDTPLKDRLQNFDRNRHELLLIDPDGYILEGATTNLLFIKGRQILTPASKCLPGITRQVLSEHLNGTDWQWCPVNIPMQQLPEFEEILLCGSGKEIARIVSIQGKDWQPRGREAFEELAAIFERAKYTES